MADGNRRGHSNTGALLLAAAAFTGMAFASGSAAARTYAITSTSMADTTGDHICTLREAVKAVNNHAAYHECVGPDSSADVITLKAGIGDYSMSSALSITRSVTVKSATVNTLVRLVQSSSMPVNAQIINLLDLFSQPSARSVTFEDIDFVGRGSGSVSGISGEGRDDSNMLTLNRCWVENFDKCGIDLLDLSLTLNDSSVDNNSGAGFNASFSSGVFVEGGAAATHVAINNSSITRNHCNQANNCDGGGGLGLELFRGSVSTIQNSTIADNTDGAGIFINPASFGAVITLNLRGSTIAFNTCENPGGDGSADCGVRNLADFNNEFNTVKLFGTVVAANYATDGTDSEYSGPIDTLQRSLVESTEDAWLVNTPVNSLTDYGSTNLDTLKNNGGIGQRPPLTHKPLHTSPCVDFASQSDSGSSDERHRTRPFDASFVSGPNKFDVGAVELQSGE
jgi:hypothetical protein